LGSAQVNTVLLYSFRRPNMSVISKSATLIV
jgi:hypothetical protein